MLTDSSHTPILCIDLGSTSFKAAVVDQLDNNTKNVSSVERVASVQSRWTGSDGNGLFDIACEDIILKAKQLMQGLPVAAIALTGVREGVVLSTPGANKPLRVMGNAEAIEWQTRYGVDWLNELLSRYSTSGVVVSSLQGWLAHRMTGGTLSITDCEYVSLSPHGTSIQIKPEQLPMRIHSGQTVGTFNGVPVAIAGTDEYASHFGCLTDDRAIELGTGTYWALSRVMPTIEYEAPTHIRILPKVAPYPSVASYVGFRFGEMLQTLSDGISLRPPTDVPEWSQSAFVDAVVSGDSITLAEGEELIASDVVRAVGELPQLNGSRLVLHGGGIKTDFALRIVRRSADLLNLEVETMEGDPTMLGSARVVANAL